MNLFDDLSALVALGSAFVSGLSALYARWQAGAAKRANDIALHESRLSIYKGLARFRVHLTGNGPNLKEEEVWRFLEAAEMSDFYFPAGTFKKLMSIFEGAQALLILNEEWRDARGVKLGRAQDLVKLRYDRIKEMRDECVLITNELKPFLRVGMV